MKEVFILSVQQQLSPSECVVVKNLHKSYHDHLVLEGVNMTLYYGEIYGILGRNGVGKTTLIECMVGLRPYEQGEVVILGATDVNEVIEQVGIQPQEANLFPRQTVEETLKLFASFYKQPMDIKTLIDMLEMNDILKKQVKDLSVGQRQRLLVSLALVGDPTLIILDEPTSGLDPQVRRFIWDCLIKMKERNKTILLSTHYMDEAEKICDRISILHNKKIVAEGSLQELIQEHRKKMTDTLEDIFIYLTDK